MQWIDRIGVSLKLHPVVQTKDRTHEMDATDILDTALQTKRNELRAELILQAEISDDDARRTNNARARQAANARKNACLNAYDDAAYGAINNILSDTGKLVVALHAACKVLGLPSAVRNAALNK